MIMMTTHFTGKVPFTHVYIHGIMRDHEGKKCPSPKGNLLDPIQTTASFCPSWRKRHHRFAPPGKSPQIAKNREKLFPMASRPFGADACLFTFASSPARAAQSTFDFKRCEGYRNFCNKRCERHPLCDDERGRQRLRPGRNPAGLNTGGSTNGSSAACNNAETSVTTALDSYHAF